jgi:hypothetical protein
MIRSSVCVIWLRNRTWRRSDEPYGSDGGAGAVSAPARLRSRRRSLTLFQDSKSPGAADGAPAEATLGGGHRRKIARDWREETNTPADLPCMIDSSGAMPTRIRAARSK